MFEGKKIVTVGISPSWDIKCIGKNLEWGNHSRIESQTIVPAGKALNVSRALAWLGRESTAAGLWGEDDYQQMVNQLAEISGLVDVKITKCHGPTRHNITIVDKILEDKEMHLRAPNPLASHKSLELLINDLVEIVDRNSVCVFAGAMPTDKLPDDCLEIIRQCRQVGAEIVLDTGGKALRILINDGPVSLIKPNMDELRELLNVDIDDEPDRIIAAARKLSDKVEFIVISRGQKGAVAVTSEQAWNAVTTLEGLNIAGTVGCGDYLLTGLVDGLMHGESISVSLARGIKAATARAAGWTDTLTWEQTRDRIEVTVSRIE